MEPQIGQNLGPETILALMRKVKKADPMFKVLKKLKTALETIGYQHLSKQYTKDIVLFHFGLGGQLDSNMIKQTGLPEYVLESPIILPGKSFCIVRLETPEQAQQYLSQQIFNEVTQNIAALKYTQVSFQNINRLMIAFCCMEAYICEHPVEDIENTNSVLEEGQIPGMVLLNDFLTQGEEMELLRHIDAGKWSRLNNRRVQHYGFEFKYGRNQIDKDEKLDNELPKFLAPILDKFKQLPCIPHSFDQLTINDYFPGDGIPAHFDTHSPFEEIFVAVSMLSGIVMDFRRFDGLEKNVFLKRRSLMVFGGEGRYAWTHGITGRKMDKVDNKLMARERRISLTFRKIRQSPCTCNYYFYCDSQGYDQDTMKKTNPLLKKYLFETQLKPKLENTNQNQIYQKYVVEAYQGVGCSFHNKIIQGVQELIIEYLRQNQGLISILDVGCGNGEYKNILDQSQQSEQTHYMGIQLCENMEDFEGKLLMNGLYLGFRERCIDLVLCVAVLHHMPTVTMRKAMLAQINRVLADDGRLILSVFNWDSKKDVYPHTNDILLQYCVPSHKGPKTNNPTAARVEKKGRVYERYYHLFLIQELTQLLNQSGFQIINSFCKDQNLVVEAKKAKKVQILLNK